MHEEYTNAHKEQIDYDFVDCWISVSQVEIHETKVKTRRYCFFGVPQLLTIRNSRMCEEENVNWYPMRATYSRELKVKDTLDSLGIDNYIPMTYGNVKIGDDYRRQLIPALHNLIFVHSTEDVLKNLKANNSLLSSLRFLMKKSVLEKDAKAEILTVSSKEMENFIKATKDHEEMITYLDNQNNQTTLGDNVRICGGIFCGVEGQIKRIKKNKRVIVCAGSMFTIMLNFVPSSFLEKINNIDEEKI